MPLPNHRERETRVQVGIEDCLAMSDEERCAWFERSLCTKAQARRAFAGDYGGPLSSFRVTAGWMRPASCEVHPEGIRYEHDLDHPAECECFCVDEGWHFECTRAHPEAVAVWKVELA